MSKSIPQDTAYRRSLAEYAEKHGVGRASRKYDKSRSCLCLGKQRSKQAAVRFLRSSSLLMRPLPERARDMFDGPTESGIAEEMTGSAHQFTDQRLL